VSGLPHEFADSIWIPHPFRGTFFEGETILVLGGFLAHRGYLDIRLVIAVSFLGSLLGDQLFFFLGRYRGNRILSRRPDWKAKAEAFGKYLDRYDTLIIIGFRFLYGLRTIAPFAIGLGRVSNLKFIILNIGSALLWSLSIGMAGYFFGHTVEFIIGDIQRAEIFVIGFIVLVSALIIAVRRRRAGHNNR